MLEIHVPLWLVLTISGLPILFLSGLAVRIIRMKPWKDDRPGCHHPIEFADRSETFGIHIHRQLLEQHVDTVFASLAALLDTERIKLKTLVKHSWLPLGNEQPQPVKAESDEEEFHLHDTKPAEMSLDQSVSLLVGQGLPPDQIAARLGISRSEVALVLKMRAGRRPLKGTRMQAVA
jgi:hypothetical protein